MDWLNIGLQLTIVGMSIVFFLLAVMALLIALLTRWDREPASVEPVSASREFPEGLDADTLAAITIAVRAHRITLRKQAAPAMRKHQPGTLPSRWVAIGRARQTTGWQNLRRR
ncbi:MAG: OadG family protein [Anaerolineae bacterium]|nr:OadG family protein [Anaerolineae bacterium]